ncbi:MAG: nucleotidyltransferase family protein [Candidatus Rokuibacteriota bacterium]|nr:MAG: nucleotidyltransferase family protein [Candidatus Rokubacteria bacterium]
MRRRKRTRRRIARRATISQSPKTPLIAAIVLAAGFARRMGRQKLLLELKGKPVVRWSVEVVLPHVGDCVVVTGQDDATVRGALAGLAVRFAVNPRPQDGQGSSIAIGAAALKPWTAAAFVALGDQPLTPGSVIPALLAAQQRGGKAIAAPSYRGTRGTPVLFSSEVFPELRALGGDAGARAVLDARPERVEVVELDVAMPADVDTPEDFARLHVQ